MWPCEVVSIRLSLGVRPIPCSRNPGLGGQPLLFYHDDSVRCWLTSFSGTRWSISKLLESVVVTSSYGENQFPDTALHALLVTTLVPSLSRTAAYHIRSNGHCVSRMGNGSLSLVSQVPETGVTIILSADFTSVGQHRTAAALLTDIPSLEQVPRVCWHIGIHRYGHYKAYVSEHLDSSISGDESIRSLRYVLAVATETGVGKARLSGTAAATTRRRGRSERIALS